MEDATNVPSRVTGLRKDVEISPLNPWRYHSLPVPSPSVNTVASPLPRNRTSYSLNEFPRLGKLHHSLLAIYGYLRKYRPITPLKM